MTDKFKPHPEPERIYLAPRCCTNPAEGRIWCEDDVWPLDDCPEHASGVEYIRADLARLIAPEQDTAQKNSK